MNIRLLHQLPPAENNPRNSEGSFLRGKHGEILFAYSRYHGESNHDHAACDIALIVSYDEGETWSEPRLIATAAEFGTKNIMSVSAMAQKNGDLAFYFPIKENDFTTTIGRTVSSDGERWTSERCEANFEKNYYVINNDRFVRLRDGRIVAPTAYLTAEEIQTNSHLPMITTLFVSDDDGKSFYRTGQEIQCEAYEPEWHRGYLEPGIIEYSDRLYLWMRTNLGRQYQAISTGALDEFCPPHVSDFTSPNSPMQIKEFDGVAYAIYNPIPKYDGRYEIAGAWGRTPFVLRKSLDNGKTFGALNVIEDDPTRGYCYPAIFRTKDKCLLIGYCRGDAVDGNTLCRLGIAKIEIDSIAE